MLAAIGLLLAVAVVVPLSTSLVRPRLQVQIAPEGGVSLTESELRAVASEIRRIWAPVVDILVITPWDRQPSIAADSIPLVITTRTLDMGAHTGLGWIDFVDGEPLPEITVSETAALQMMRGGSWRGAAFTALPPRASRLFLEHALARAAAHEIGHYLLRTRTHARRGLMRPMLSVDQIMDTRAGAYRLEPADAARLRQSAPTVARVN